MTTSTAFADAIRQALAPHQSSYDVPANTPQTWSAAHWQTVDALGLPALLLPEAAGGSGATLSEAAAAIEALGALGDPSPAADTAVLAWCLYRDDAPIPDGPLVLAAGDGFMCWPENATAIGADGNVQRHERQPVTGQLLNSAPFTRAIRNEKAPSTQRGYPTALAATRALQLAGAAAAALDLTAGYVRERRQFGRPLARFQAVQQHIAVAAAELAAAAQVARAAFASLDRGPSFLPAAAKIAAGRAATAVAAQAHQFHGAMGYTAAYPLHRLTRAIWQWREDYGNESWWSRRLGEQVCQDGADALWPAIVAA